LVHAPTITKDEKLYSLEEELRLRNALKRASNAVWAVRNEWLKKRRHPTFRRLCYLIDAKRDSATGTYKRASELFEKEDRRKKGSPNQKKIERAYRLMGEAAVISRARRELEDTLLQCKKETATEANVYYATRSELIACLAERASVDEEYRKFRNRARHAAKLDSIEVAMIDSDGDAPGSIVDLYFGGVEFPEGEGHGHTQLRITANRNFEKRYERGALEIS
jgi:hypothetical protein